MLRVGIVGTGMVAKEHARSIALTGGQVQLVAATDISVDRLDAFSDEFGVPRRHQDAAALIADPEVDLVTIAAPPSAHEELAIAALEAGKFVLCEKPLAHSLASARRIAAAAQRFPGKLAISYQFRYEPQYRRMRWLIDNGWIGALEGAQVARHSYIPQASVGDLGWWGVWSVSGGGVLITQLVHELDLLQLVMGSAVSVRAELDTRFAPIESEDYLLATITFEGDRKVECYATVNSGYLGGGVEFRGASGVAGSNGLLVGDPRRQQRALRAVDQALPETRIVDGSMRGIVRRVTGRTTPEFRPHAELYLDIADRIARGEPLPIPAREALASLELCMAIYEAGLRGGGVSLPLGPDSLVTNGVQKADYDARPRPSRRAVPTIFRRPDRPPPATLPRAAINVAKRVLGTAGIEPATIRAMVRRPMPVHGGPPIRRTPWPRRRHFDARERRAAMRILTREIRSGDVLTYGGPEEEAYCNAFATFLGGGYADAVNSGSNAVYLALRALDLPPGSEVVVPPITDPGGVMPVVLNLCIPVPADSEPGSILTSAEQIRRVITDRTSAIIVAHMGGHAVDMDPILDLADERGIPVVEDCAQSHGTRYKGRLVGSLGDISAFSTMFGKQHGTGGQGGVVFTRDPLLYIKVRQLADRGKSFDPSGSMSNVVASLNFNQDELSMAIGKVQLEKLPAAVRGRRTFAECVSRGLAGLKGVELLGDPPNCESSYWYLMVRFDPEHCRVNSHDLAASLAREGIDGVHAGYSVYPTDQTWHRTGAVFTDSALPWSLVQGTPRVYSLPNAHEANARMVRIEIHESLREREARDLVAAIKKVADYYRA